MKNQKLSVVKVVSLLIFFMLIWFFIGIHSDAINSGFHFVDDWRFYDIKNNLQQDGFYKTYQAWVTSEFGIRLRPMFTSLQVVECYLWGVNFKSWMISHLFLATLTSLFFSMGALILGATFLESALFPLLVLFGKSSPIWWRLGVAESYALFFFSIGIFFYLLFLKEKSKRWFFLSQVLILFSALSKESFILLYPAIVVFHFLYNRYQNRDQTFLKQLIKDFSYFLIQFFISLTLVLVIVFKIGTEEMGYAGIENQNYLYFKTLVRFYNESYLSIPLALFLLSIFWVLMLKKERAIFYDWLKVLRNRELLFSFFLLLVVILIPQIYLYTKSGIYERYLQPASFVVGLLVIAPFHYLKKIFFNHSPLKRLSRTFFLVSLLVMILSFLLVISHEFSLKIVSLYSLFKPNIPDYFINKMRFFSLFFLITSSLSMASLLGEKWKMVIGRIYHSENINSLVSKSFFFLIVFYLMNLAFTTYRHGEGHVKAASFIKEQVAILDQYSQKDDLVLYVLDPIQGELIEGMKKFLKEEKGRDNYLLWPIQLNPSALAFENKIRESILLGNQTVIINNQKIDELKSQRLTIFVHKNLEDYFLENSKGWFFPKDYLRFELSEMINGYARKH